MIYFVTARDVGRVKIGFSENPRARFSKICSDSPLKLALERVCEGDECAEAALHHMFRQFHVHGEWFALAPEVEAHMGTLPIAMPVEREKSLNQIVAEALGCSKSYVTQILSDKYAQAITIPIAVTVYRHAGIKLGPIETATDEEIDTLEKFCGHFRQPESAAA